MLKVSYGEPFRYKVGVTAPVGIDIQAIANVLIEVVVKNDRHMIDHRLEKVIKLINHDLVEEPDVEGTDSGKWRVTLLKHLHELREMQLPPRLGVAEHATSPVPISWWKVATRK